MTTLKIADFDLSNLSYDPLTGLITNTKTKKVYDKSNDGINGYINIRLRNLITNKLDNLKVHRIAYYIYHGAEPNHIDHQNGNRIDNRIVNLISCTNATNMQNKKRYKNNTYLPCVVKKSNGNFQARGYSVRIGGKISYGTYATELDAHYTATFYKSIHYANYKGADLPDINGLPHPYFTGTLPNIVSAIYDTSGNSALTHMSK